MISLKRFWGKDISISILLIFLFATMIRILFLDMKPTHFDEGVNGWFVEQIKLHGVFDYNPENFHGPLYFYLLWIFDSLFGSSIVVHRLVAVFSSLAAMYMLLKTQKLLGHISPLGLFAYATGSALVFYSRYSIHESLLLLGFSVWLYGALRLIKSSDKKSLWWLASGFLIMATTKETFLIFIINTAIALTVVRLWQRKPLFVIKPFTYVYPFLFATIGLVFFYSKLFTDFSEVKEFFTAFYFWKDTGFRHTGHEKSFFYWLGLMVRYEWISLAGFLLSIPFAFAKDKNKQFLTVFAFGNLLVFSLISYKTPWCILVLLYPYFLFLNTKNKKLKLILWVIAIASALKAVHLNYWNYAKPSEPYVYVQSSPLMKEVTDVLMAWVKEHPSHAKTTFLVQSESQWPLPWLLKDYKAAQYFADLPSDWRRFEVLIVDIDEYRKIAPEVLGNYFIKNFQIRYEQQASVLLVSKSKTSLIQSFAGVKE